MPTKKEKSTPTKKEKVISIKKEKNIQPIVFNKNTNLPNIWIDSFTLAKRNDDICMLRFFTHLPEGHFEQSRIITSKQNLEILVDKLCSALKYSPKIKKTIK